VESKTGNNRRLYNGDFAVVLRAADGEKLLSRSLTTDNVWAVMLRRFFSSCYDMNMNMNMKKQHLITEVADNSIAAEMSIVAGDVLLAVNGVCPEDVLDYRFLVANERVELLICKADGEEWEMEIAKEEQEDLGLSFGEGLMDEYRSCQNKCIFCFIDQLPAGLRESLYFKDDDARLSFLQGNYITLTNMSEADLARIVRYRLAPINISVHTTNPALRCLMQGNPRAGEALGKIKTLAEAGIAMNGQIVLCKGINDGAELERTIGELAAFIPQMESVSVVPVGLTKHRAGLYELSPFNKEDAQGVLQTVHYWQEEIYKKHGTHFVHAADEWYMLAEKGLPPAARYDGYPQLENGVGMLRLFLDECAEAFDSLADVAVVAGREVSVATGLLAYPYIKALAARFTGVTVHVYGIINHFFGEGVTVSGLLTGVDLISQLQGKPLGERLLLPANILRYGEDLFLDGLTVAEVEGALQVRVDIVELNGYNFVKAIMESARGE
jgi:putative radical SAM enzyme (TIGR03279 family)